MNFFPDPNAYIPDPNIYLYIYISVHLDTMFTSHIYTSIVSYAFSLLFSQLPTI